MDKGTFYDFFFKDWSFDMNYGTIISILKRKKKWSPQCPRATWIFCWWFEVVIYWYSQSVLLGFLRGIDLRHEKALLLGSSANIEAL